MTMETAHTGVAEPSSWVRLHAGGIVPGSLVLDLACGSGRHALFLRDLGHRVLAVDNDLQALARLAGEPGIEAMQADLEAAPWPFGPAAFDAIVVTNYLHRPLFPSLCDALRPGGRLIYETFALGNERYGRPANPRFLLKRDELLHLVAPLQVVAYEHGIVHRPKTAVVQRICAVSSEEPIDLKSGLPVAAGGALG